MRYFCELRARTLTYSYVVQMCVPVMKEGVIDVRIS